MARPAIFWDRDGTLIEDPGYLRDADQVNLLPGAADALRRLASAGYENVVATNQSGVARGMMDETTVEKIHLRLREMLAKEGAGLDAIYYCPYLDGSEAVVEKYRRDSDLRKPKPGMLVHASLERNLDLPASWSIGDSLRDAEAGRAAGCRTILISQDGHEETNTTRRSAVDFVARSLAEAADIVLKYTPGVIRVPPAEEVSLPSETRTLNASPASPGDQAVLHEILATLQRIERQARTEDFSLPRLGGAIMQMVAIGALIWAIFSLNEGTGTQLIRLTYTMVFQLIALTLFLANPRKKQ